jgi:hypothetical protein
MRYLVVLMSSINRSDRRRFLIHKIHIEEQCINSYVYFSTRMAEGGARRDVRDAAAAAGRVEMRRPGHVAGHRRHGPHAGRRAAPARMRPG